LSDRDDAVQSTGNGGGNQCAFEGSAQAPMGGLFQNASPGQADENGKQQAGQRPLPGVGRSSVSRCRVLYRARGFKCQWNALAFFCSMNSDSSFSMMTLPS
jgi:hypothetical protein